MANEPPHKQEFRIRDLTTRKVTLFPTRAQIIRDIKEITLQPGANQIVIDGLTPTVDEHSIKVEGTGSATITDVTIDFIANREVYEDIYPSDSEDESDLEEDDSDVEVDEMKAINEKLKQLNVKILDEQEKINSAAHRLRICDAFGNSVEKNRPPPNDLETLIKAYEVERQKIYGAHEKATSEVAKIREEMAKAEKQKLKVAKAVVEANEKSKKEKEKAKEKKLRKKAEISKEKQRIRTERETFWPKKVYCVTINIETSSFTPGSSRRNSIDGDTIINQPSSSGLATSEFHEPSTKPLKTGEISLSLSYITYSASWAPRYDLSLNSVKLTGLLEYGAELKNTTSETWRDAHVLLSTSQTTFSGLSETIPQLLPWHVRLYKGGRNGDSALFSAHELEAKKKEWNQSTGEQSQKPRWEVFGRDNAVQNAYLAQERQHALTKKMKTSREAVQYASRHANPTPTALFGAAAAQPAQSNSLFRNLEQADLTQRARKSGGAPTWNGHSSHEEMEEDDGDQGFALFDDDEAPNKSLTFEEGAWEESGLTTTYDIPGLKTISPSNSTIKHKIAKIDFKNVVFSHIVIGKLRQVAFLKARLRNTSKITLLKGPLGLTLDSSFLGQASFPRCSSGETFSLPLGVDPAININYPKPTVRRSQTGIFSKEDTNVFTRSMTIMNTKHNAAIDLTVLDQIPVSEDERLKIEITNPRGLKAGGEGVRAGQPTTFGPQTLSRGTAKEIRASVQGMETPKDVKWGSAVATAKKGGEIAWNVKLNPGQGVKLMLEYEACFPGGETVAVAQQQAQAGSRGSNTTGGAQAPGMGMGMPLGSALSAQMVSQCLHQQGTDSDELQGQRLDIYQGMQAPLVTVSFGHQQQHHSGLAGQFSLPPTGMGYAPVEGGNRSRGKNNTSKKVNPFCDPDALCAECGSLVHQLGNHPNPNHSSGVLRGCARCNTKEHSYWTCPKMDWTEKKKKQYHFFRRCREGRCPLEFHGDFREIINPQGKFTLEHMPLTPDFALRNPYPNEQQFRSPRNGGDPTLKVDPFWSSANPWQNLRSLAFSGARVSEEDGRFWDRRAGARRGDLWEQLRQEQQQQQHPQEAPVQTAEAFAELKAQLASMAKSLDEIQRGGVSAGSVKKEEDDDHKRSDIAQSMLDPQPGRVAGGVVKKEEEDENNVSDYPIAPHAPSPSSQARFMLGSSASRGNDSRPSGFSGVRPATGNFQQGPCHHCQGPHFKRDCPQLKAKLKARGDRAPGGDRGNRRGRDRRGRGGGSSSKDAFVAHTSGSNQVTFEFNFAFTLSNTAACCQPRNSPPPAIFLSRTTCLFLEESDSTVTMPLTCRHCKKQFIDADALSKHKDAVHDWSCNYCDEISLSNPESFVNEIDLIQHNEAKHNFKCKYCDRVCKTEEARYQHENSPAHILKCTKCIKVYKTETGRESHYNSTHVYTCDTCNSTFDARKALDKHNTIAHRIPCQHCIKVFKNTEDLEVHVTEFHSFRCKKCSRIFETDENLQKHMADDHVFRCTKCPRTFGSEIGHSIHYTTTHSFKCETCKVVFNTLREKDDHAKAMHSITCTKCQAAFDNQELLKIHVTKMHVFKCKKCAMEFESTAVLSQHFASSHILKCPLCPEAFETVEARTTHFRISHEYECHVCKETFATLQALAEHSRTHQRNCEECDASFDSEIALNRHKTSHKYRCMKCLEASDSLGGLQGHTILAHSREALLKCSACAALFREENELADHVKSHEASTKVSADSLGSDVQCPECRQSFNTSGLLKAHYLDTHFFKCSICPSAIFTDEKSCDEHIKAYHELKKDDLSLVNAAVKYPCSNCGTTYDFPIELATHVLQTHFLRCKHCSGLRFSTLQELSEHTAQSHMPVSVFSSSTQTEAMTDISVTEKLGFSSCSTDNSDGSSQDAHSSHEAEQSQVYKLPSYETKAMQTTEFKCDECVTVFENEEELDVHMDHSPFHGAPALFCTECHIGPFRDQIELLKHIESKPHKTQWVLSMI
ncbi:uncharacterized protein LY89DRAFT_782855 [Mollisia scopiformis]|uniref:C2H2-type domain-containing protein n=1 Tax=Mollisia scopiformis TaxID=149040 RepID=A0A194XA34_MOLSC|nr:uncharacterized protein LY89DRAFT_782855 [Mollisia scopiformis]KUJ16627.1 hypothetical protein LY89DRAFT_782855 [Mollisia scopiformis]